MDWSKVIITRIALKFSYIGKDYCGLVVQENTRETVETKLFEALVKCCLIDSEEHISKVIYTRCGRTDKGVSALANVCSLLVRKLPKGDYCSRINHCLPDDIRVLAYAEVPQQFDARFSCIFREYKYFFLKQDMDVSKIKEACKRYVGMHDFRNFCKMDESAKFGFEANNEDGEDAGQNFERRIYSFKIVEVSENKYDSNKNVCMAIIKGSAFLWHQVRYMMSVLFMIGKGQEEMNVINTLLDIELIKERPNYEIADGQNLILSECGFEGISWKNHNLFADIETFKVYDQ